MEVARGEVWDDPGGIVVDLRDIARADDIIVFFFQAEDGIRDGHVTGVQTCALPIWQLPTAFRRQNLLELCAGRPEFFPVSRLSAGSLERFQCVRVNRHLWHSTRTQNVP